MALNAALALLVAAVAATVVVGKRAGVAPAALASAMITLAWQYSAPPGRFCARGLGEATTALVVTVMVPVFGFLLQARAVGRPILLAAALPCALQFAMLLAIEFPDAAGDAAAGKRTLVVRLGALPAARLYAALTLAAFGALPLWALAGLARARGAGAAGAGAGRRLAGGAGGARRLRRSGALGQHRLLVGGAADRKRGHRAGGDLWPAAESKLRPPPPPAGA